jgi:hypothetical protein
MVLANEMFTLRNCCTRAENLQHEQTLAPVSDYHMLVCLFVKLTHFTTILSLYH